MRNKRLTWAPLLLSVVLAGGGMYGCSMHEWALEGRGQGQDWITHSFALSAYLGMLGFVPALIWFVSAVIQADRKRRR